MYDTKKRHVLKDFRILIMVKKLSSRKLSKKQQEKKVIGWPHLKKKINLDINEFHSIREVLLKCF